MALVTVYRNLDQNFETGNKTYIFSKTYMQKLAKKFAINDNLNLNLPRAMRSNLILEWYPEFKNRLFYSRFINQNNLIKVKIFNFKSKQEIKHTCLNDLEINSPTLQEIHFIGFNFCYSIDNSDLIDGHGYPLLRDNPNLKKVVFNGFNNVFEIIIEGFRKVYPVLLNNPSLKIVEFKGFPKLKHVRGQNLELDQIDLVRSNFIKNCPSILKIKVDNNNFNEYIRL